MKYDGTICSETLNLPLRFEGTRRPVAEEEVPKPTEEEEERDFVVICLIRTLKHFLRGSKKKTPLRNNCFVLL
jgi:hypothetical protein